MQATNSALTEIDIATAPAFRAEMPEAVVCDDATEHDHLLVEILIEA
jgi:hypothetical protein